MTIRLLTAPDCSHVTSITILWSLQVVGTAFQMKHYKMTLGAISDRWSDGFVGSGIARAQFGAGAIAIVVASPDMKVRQVMVMHGRTVFAKFRTYPDLVGIAVAKLCDGSNIPPKLGRSNAAIKLAIAQIDRIVAERNEPPLQPISMAEPLLEVASSGIT